jgi:hypothetical protein
MNPPQSKEKQTKSGQGLQRALEGILERLRQGLEEIANGLNGNRPEPIPLPVPVDRRRR